VNAFSVGDYEVWAAICELPLGRLEKRPPRAVE
jgi:hypothetical protein